MSTIDDIKAQLRAAMNGVAASAIRRSGMSYRLVYGVELPRLRQIAGDILQEEDSTPQSLRRLAIQLWQEDIRECRQLAILLYPVPEFDADIAGIWIDSIRPEQAELAQLLSMDILCHTPYAAEQSFRWMADERPLFQLCGFLTLTRLLMQGAQLSPSAEMEFLDQAAAAQASDYLPLRKAAQNAILHNE